MRTLAIVPAFNEARSLPRVVEGLLRGGLCDVCVVDDASTDATAEVAARAGATVLRLPVNLGIGGAVQTGYRWARDHGYDAAVQVDGDGQHDPACLPDLLDPLREGRADLCVASRFLAAEGFQSTAMRRAGIRYLCLVLRARAGLTVTDPTSGFRAGNRRVIERFAASYPSDYPEPESLATAAGAGLRIAEVPVRMHARTHGESSIGLLDSVYYLVKVSLALLVLPGAEARRAGDLGEVP